MLRKALLTLTVGVRRGPDITKPHASKLRVPPRGNRGLLALIAAVALVGALAVPAQAGKPPTVAIATQSWDGCTHTATYTWSGFTGRVTAAVGFFRTPGGSESTSYVAHGHDGSVTYTSVGISNSTHDFKAIGDLFDRNLQVIPGSHAESSTETHDCF